MKNKYTYIVVEDEPLQLANLVDTLNMRLDLELLDSFESAEEAYEFLTSSEKKNPDVMFLDMQLPEVNGLQFLEAIKRINPKPKVIITTAFEDYAIPSYEYDVCGYVVKPIENSKLNIAIDKAIKELSNHSDPTPKMNASTKNNNSLFIKVENRMVKLFHEEIIFMEGANVNVKIKTPQEEYTTRDTLKNMEYLLPSEDFMRIHDSFIVNLKYLKGYARNFTQLDLQFDLKSEKFTLPVGKKYRDIFKNKMIG